MTDLTNINAALTRVGSEVISSIDEATAGAKIAKNNYEKVVLDELTKTPWKWATTTVTLGAPIEGTAPEPWLYARTLPFPVIRVRTVKVSGVGIKYEIMTDKLLSDYSGSYTLVVNALWRQAETYWPADFAELVTMRMQQIFLRGIGERYAEAADLEKPIFAQRSAARLSDAQSMPPRDPWVSKTLEARVA